MRRRRCRPDPTSGVSATGGSIRLVNPPFSPDGMQDAVLSHTAGPLLVTGAAGTGKSSVLRERFAQLVEGGADPERVALIVGSRRARQIDARRADRPAACLALQPSGPDLPWARASDPPRALLRARVLGASRGPLGRRSVRARAGSPARTGSGGVAGVRSPPHAPWVRGPDPAVPPPRAGSSTHAGGDPGQGRIARAHRLARARAFLPDISRCPGRRSASWTSRP